MTIANPMGNPMGSPIGNPMARTKWRADPPPPLIVDFTSGSGEDTIPRGYTRVRITAVGGGASGRYFGGAGVSGGGGGGRIELVK